MLIKTGSYTGDGIGLSQTCGFRPELLIAKGEGTVDACFLHPINWSARTQALGRNTVLGTRARLNARGFGVNDHADLNTAGSAHYWACLSDNQSGSMTYFSYVGTETDNRVIADLLTKKPELLFVKRDSNKYGIFKLASHPDNISKSCEAAAESDWIKTLNDDGSFVVSDDPAINEWKPLTDKLGEAHDGFAFYPGDHIQTIPYTGNSTGRVIPHNIADPKLVFVIPRGARIPMFTTDVMVPSASFMDNSACDTGYISDIDSSGVTISNDGAVNADGENYYMVVVGQTTNAERSAIPRRLGTQPRMKFHNYAGSHGAADCGTDDSLSISGSCSFEFHGRLVPEAVSNISTEIPIMNRASGTTGGIASAGTHNWGFGYRLSIGIFVITGTYYDLNLVDDDVGSLWRTGFVPHDQVYHLMFTHGGNGYWRMFVDGVCRKVRDVDMVAQYGVANIAGIAGAKTAIGGRASTAGAIVQKVQAHDLYRARIYDRELTADEVMTRYRISALNAEYLTDVSDFIEEWGAVVGTTSTLPATNDSNNNGTLDVANAAWNTRFA
jgi:hypothetical protein